MNDNDEKYEKQIKEKYRLYILACIVIFSFCMFAADFTVKHPVLFNFIFMLFSLVMMAACIFTWKYLYYIDNKHTLSKWNYFLLLLIILSSFITYIASFVALFSKIPPVHFSQRDLLFNYHCFIYSIFVLTIAFIFLYLSSLGGGVYKKDFFKIVMWTLLTSLVFLIEVLLNNVYKSMSTMLIINIAFLGVTNIVFDPDNWKYFVPKINVSDAFKSLSRKIRFFLNLCNASFYICQIPWVESKAIPYIRKLLMSSIFSSSKSAINIINPTCMCMFFTMTLIAAFLYFLPGTFFLIWKVIMKLRKLITLIYGRAKKFINKKIA